MSTLGSGFSASSALLKVTGGVIVDSNDPVTIATLSLVLCGFLNLLFLLFIGVSAHNNA